LLLQREIFFQKKQAPSGITFTCNEKGCMTELKIKWLTEVWDIRLCVPLQKRSILDLDALKGHLTWEAETQNF